MTQIDLTSLQSEYSEWTWFHLPTCRRRNLLEQLDWWFLETRRSAMPSTPVDLIAAFAWRQRPPHHSLPKKEPMMSAWRGEAPWEWAVECCEVLWIAVEKKRCILERETCSLPCAAFGRPFAPAVSWWTYCCRVWLCLNSKWREIATS